MIRSVMGGWWPGMLLGLWAGLATGPVGAHSDEYFDARPAPHGGQIRMAGPLHLELCREARQVVVYVTDHLEQPLPTSGGHAMLRIAGSAQPLALPAAGENRFAATPAAPLAVDSELVLFVEMPGQPAQSARYGKPSTPAAAAPETSHAGHHP